METATTTDDGRTHSITDSRCLKEVLGSSPPQKKLRIYRRNSQNCMWSGVIPVKNLRSQSLKCGTRWWVRHWCRPSGHHPQTKACRRISFLFFVPSFVGIRKRLARTKRRLRDRGGPRGFLASSSIYISCIRPLQKQNVVLPNTRSWRPSHSTARYASISRDQIKM